MIPFFLSRSLCFPGCLFSVFLSTSTSWCSWTSLHGCDLPSGWSSVRVNFLNPVLRRQHLVNECLSSLPQGFAIYFLYGIKNSSENADRSFPRKYELASQNNSPVYKGTPDESNQEAGSLWCGPAQTWGGVTKQPHSFVSVCSVGGLKRCFRLKRRGGKKAPQASYLWLRGWLDTVREPFPGRCVCFYPV